MHLVKWIRKNERKIMTFVVIFIMIAFIGGYALQQLMMRLGKGSEVWGYYGQNHKLTSDNHRNAQGKLRILGMLGTDRLLFGMKDFKTKLLGQLLFADPHLAAGVRDEMIQAAMMGQLQCSVQEIDNFFNQAQGSGELFWILLNAEAKKAGVVISDSKARETLKMIIPRLYPGTDASVLINNIVTNFRASEDMIIRTFADFMGILSYAQLVMANEDVTIEQVKATIGRNGEKIDAEFIRLDAAAFVDEKDQPSEQKLKEQFENYKNYLPGEITPQNPYGFGYKIPPRVSLEYLAVKLNDVRDLITKPTQEEAEEFYQLNLNNPQYASLFVYEEKIDPNDPASEAISKTKTYAEASIQILNLLVQDKINRHVDMIFNEARELTEAGFANLDMAQADSGQLKKFAGDYKTTAEKLSEKYNINIYTSKTGLLSIVDIANDTYLGTLSIPSQSTMPTPLSSVVFAVDEIALTNLGRFDTAKRKMWENIGPMTGSFLAKEELTFEPMMAILRVINAQKATVPTDLNVEFSTMGMILDESEEDAKTYHRVKDKVAFDCKIQKAMETTKARARELVQLINDKGWEQAIEKFNELYGQKENQTIQPAFTLENLSPKSRVSRADLNSVKMLQGDNPQAEGLLNKIAGEKTLLDRLYALIPPKQTQALDLKDIVEIKAQASLYVVKEVNQKPVFERDYHMAKSFLANQLDVNIANNLGIRL